MAAINGLDEVMEALCLAKMAASDKTAKEMIKRLREKGRRR